MADWQIKESSRDCQYRVPAPRAGEKTAYICKIHKASNDLFCQQSTCPKWIDASGVVCPFCGEDDFDLQGLKGHLQHDCSIYWATEAPIRLFSNKSEE